MSFQPVNNFSKKEENVKKKDVVLNAVTSTANGKKDIKPRKKWKVGNFCQAMYSKVGELVEAQIVKIDEQNKNCVVRLLGYDDEEEASLIGLRLSMGKSIRQSQIDVIRSSLQLSSSDETSSSCNSDGSYSASEDTSREENPYVMPDRSDASRHSKSARRAHCNCYMRHQSNIPEPPFLPGELRMMALNGENPGDNEELVSMMLAWHMAGYRTGYYQGLHSGDGSGNHGERRKMRR